VSGYVCSDCGGRLANSLDSCPQCGGTLSESVATRASVEIVTQVMVPSTGHEDVPYWCALVCEDDGSRAIVKLDHEVTVGDTVALGRDDAVDLATVGILGTGVMGRGLAELLLTRGHHVVWIGRSGESVSRGWEKVAERLSRVMDETDVQETRGRLTTGTEHALLGECDVVIEAVVEEMLPKSAMLAAAEERMRPDAILATNTSGLSLDDLSRPLQRPQQFGALHFFNPPTRMRLVETAVCEQTCAETSRFLDEFALSLGKTPVRVAATPAFAVNRSLMPLLNEAVRELEEGVASAEAIDEAVRLGLNHPMGPLALADLIGLDVVVDIMKNLADRTGDETYAPRPLLRSKVAEGALGRKAGRGFYEYPSR
jgi:3-hydroxybutyryl-CoA dehydrogenase